MLVYPNISALWPRQEEYNLLEHTALISLDV